jgi:hypothetical protein
MTIRRSFWLLLVIVANTPIAAVAHFSLFQKHAILSFHALSSSAPKRFSPFRDCEEQRNEQIHGIFERPLKIYEKCLISKVRSLLIREIIRSGECRYAAFGTDNSFAENDCARQQQQR